MSKLVSIVYKPEGEPAKEDGYIRVPLQKALLVAGHGIEGDAKGGGNRHLNIMSAPIMDGLAEQGFQTSPGQMGEQLIFSGLDINALAPGTRLQIGTQAQVELTEPRTGCAKFERHQGKLRQEASGRMGMMARVLAGGQIAIGDSVQVLDEAGVEA